MALKIGCCGFPKGREEYYRHFRLVEIQQTFYKLPRLETVRGWREQAPSDFEFTLKAWQAITHAPASPTYRKAGLQIDPAAHDRYGSFCPTDEVYAAWQQTREVATALVATVVIFQCPASFSPTDEHVANLRAFFRNIERGGLILAWEPRGNWPDDLIGGLCRELDLVHCVDPFGRPPVHGDPAYFRLHGRGGYRYRYTEDDLAQLRVWCEAHARVYCLFNNVAMWDDALRFVEQIKALRPSRDACDPVTGHVRQ